MHTRTSLLARRSLLALTGAGALLAATPILAQDGAAIFASVQEEARRLALEPYRKPPPSISPEARTLNYQQYRSIAFRPEKALWYGGNSLFRVEFFPTGLIYDTAVTINVVKDGKSTPVTAAPDMFNSGDTPLGAISLAGLRITYPLHGPKFDEIAAFLGASYFRPIGREQAYGASARGLAVDTGLPHPEEFPSFRSFWLVTPADGARELTVWALLDSPGVTGAYAFTLRPGTRTVIETTVTLYMRNTVGVLGMAPLTSMFFIGKSGPRRDDFRPEVHDSDGLYMITGAGERVWRPLGNPGALAISSFVDHNPRGFGLMQRERAFARYQDQVALYHTRPSLWVEPIGDWGDGEVRLIEIPTESEVHDNIVAFWAPRTPAKAGDRLDFRYRLAALADEPALSPTGRVVATRTSAVIGAPKQRRLVVEFTGGDVELLRAEQPVEAIVTTAGGKLRSTMVEAIPGQKMWRLFIHVEPDGRKPVELRAFLSLRGEAITETWTYAVRP